MDDEKIQKEVEQRQQLIETLLIISGIFIVFPNINLSDPNLLIYYNLAFAGLFLSAILYFISISHNMFYFWDIIFDKLENLHKKIGIDHGPWKKSRKKRFSLGQNIICCCSAINCANFFTILFVKTLYGFEFPYIKYIKIFISISLILIISAYLLQPKLLELTSKQLMYIFIYEILIYIFAIFNYF